jgi:DNA-binding response OmpR family regulator
MALARRPGDESAIRIVMFTSRREEADRVMELELSGDDNPTKPFSLRSARTDLGKPTASGSGILESVRRCIRTRESAL